MAGSETKLTELLATLSLAGDLGNGLPLETTLRVCLLASRLSSLAGIDQDQAAATYFAGILWSSGCTATSHEELVRFGRDVEIKSAMAGADFERPPAIVGRLARAHQDLGLAAIAGMVRAGSRHGQDIAVSHCEAASMLASRLGFGGPVIEALGAFFEQWDGRGGPRGIRAEAVPVAARVLAVASTAVHAARIGDDPIREIRRRSGRQLDPHLVDLSVQHSADVLDGMDAESVWQAVLAAEPEARPWVPLSRLDAFAAAMGDFVDLKSVHWLGHSAAVGQLASAAARGCGIPDTEIPALKRAALIHGVGRVAVSVRIWDKAGSLTEGEWERVRLYPYFTDRVASRTKALDELGRTASGAQERLDGSGYHRGLPASAQPPATRVLAAASAYQAMTESRSHRPAMPAPQAAAQVRADATAGKLDREAVEAVLESAGLRRRRGEWPGGLTDREVEVLRLVARGAINRDVARALTISEDTVRNHVKHVYEKIGVSTRAGAALFAMEKGLLPV